MGSTATSERIGGETRIAPRGRIERGRAATKAGGLVLAGLLGGGLAGWALVPRPAHTFEGGGMVLEQCVPGTDVLHMSNGQKIQLGVGDISTSKMLTGAGVEDAVELELVDNSLLMSDPSGGAEEYPGGDQRIIAAGHSMALHENGTVVTVELDNAGTVTLATTCPTPPRK